MGQLWDTRAVRRGKSSTYFNCWLVIFVHARLIIPHISKPERLQKTSKETPNSVARYFGSNHFQS
jgi:hypothetical protein